MTKVNKYIIALALTLCPLAMMAQGMVEARIDSIQMLVGEQTGYHVSATVKPGQRVVFPQWKPQQMITPGVEVVEAPKMDTVDAKDGFIKVTQHLVLTSFEDTLYYIPKQEVKIDGKTLKTNNLALKVLTIEVDTLHPNQFFGPKDVQENPFLWKEWAKLLWLALLAVTLYVVAWLAYIRLKSNKPFKFKVRIIKRIPPHQKALSAIQALKDEKVSLSTEDDSKAYYTQLTDALRTYMQERFGFNAKEMTSAEIISRLQQEEDQDKIEELTALFQTADLVKFAKYSTGMTEKDRNLVSAIDFINQTKQENVPTEERVEPTITKQQRQTMHVRTSLKWAIGIMIIAATALIVYVCWQLYDIRA
ncbi:MAG: hypothetical protein IJ183_05810 [Prevotella sp.]|nr:hypothetical protein [Prevotella sp.]